MRTEINPPLPLVALAREDGKPVEHRESSLYARFSPSEDSRLFWCHPPVDPTFGSPGSLTPDRSRLIPARPGGWGFCPQCGDRMMAKTGDLVLWHWAHERLHDCDRWSEPETLWHYSYKLKVPEHRREIVMGPNREHRADILNARGSVIELQHSPINADAIREREAFYGDMIWLFDASVWADRLEFRRKDDHHVFTWKYAHKSQYAIKKPLFWDLGPHGFGGMIFLVKELKKKTPCVGWGHFIDKKTFVKQFFL